MIRKEDKYFFLFMALVIAVSLFASGLDFVLLQHSSLRLDTLNVIGVILFVGGLIIRVKAIRTLGRFFSKRLRVLEDHELVTTGIYRHLRHPVYTGILLSLLAVPLMFSSAYGFLVMSSVILPIIYRINAEEKMLIIKFGGKYEEYTRHSKRLIPFVY